MIFLGSQAFYVIISKQIFIVFVLIRLLHMLYKKICLFVWCDFDQISAICYLCLGEGYTSKYR